MQRAKTQPNGYEVAYNKQAMVDHVTVHCYDTDQRSNYAVKFYIEDSVAYFSKFIGNTSRKTKRATIDDAFEYVTNLPMVNDVSNDQRTNLDALV
jgi:hypothetical protein